jgi:uncharacterized protein YjdB
MKKTLLTLMLAALGLGATSCSGDHEPEYGGNGPRLSFKISTPKEPLVVTRAAIASQNEWNIASLDLYAAIGGTVSKLTAEDYTIFPALNNQPNQIYTITMSEEWLVARAGQTANFYLVANDTSSTNGAHTSLTTTLGDETKFKRSLINALTANGDGTLSPIVSPDGTAAHNLLFSTDIEGLQISNTMEEAAQLRRREARFDIQNKNAAAGDNQLVVTGIEILGAPNSGLVFGAGDAATPGIDRTNTIKIGGVDPSAYTETSAGSDVVNDLATSVFYLYPTTLSSEAEADKTQIVVHAEYLGVEREYPLTLTADQLIEANYRYILKLNAVAGTIDIVGDEYEEGGTFTATPGQNTVRALLSPDIAGITGGGSYTTDGGNLYSSDAEVATTLNVNATSDFGTKFALTSLDGTVEAVETTVGDVTTLSLTLPTGTFTVSKQLASETPETPEEPATRVYTGVEELYTITMSEEADFSEALLTIDSGRIGSETIMLRRQGATTRIEFDKTMSNPANITGAGVGQINYLLSQMRRVLAKKSADGEMTIAYLDNKNSNLYEDGSPAKLDGSEGDVMVYKPAFYYKYESVDADHFAYSISEKDLGEGAIFSPASLIGAYKSHMADNMLYSVSGVALTSSISQENNVLYAESRGTGYNIIDFEQHSMIALLFYAKYGTRDSQTVLGVGNAVLSTISGTTNALGNADTAAAATGHASFAGIEGVHGAGYEWVSGVTIQDGVWTITNPDGSTRNITATTDSGYITDIAASAGTYFDVVPTAATGGSESTYYVDNYTYGAGGRVLTRSCRSTYAEGGISFANAYYDSSLEHVNIASRLAFRGTIVKASSIGAFKAIPVTVLVASVSLNRSSLSLTAGGATTTLQATVRPASNRVVEWSSSSPLVASVSQSGEVSPLSAGKTTITAASGGQSAACAVTVTQPVASVSLDVTKLDMTVGGGKQTLHATVLPANAANKTVTWSSSNTLVATALNGEVTPIGPGSATITVTTADRAKTATCIVTVTQPTTGVTMSQTTAAMTVGGSNLSLTATVLPATASNKTVTWTSSNTTVATVSTSGVVTAKANGTTTITATSAADATKTATCAVTVTTPVTGVSLNATTLELTPGQTFQLVPTVLPATASNKAVTWAVQYSDVVTISDTGLVTTVGEGTSQFGVRTKDGNFTAYGTITVGYVFVNWSGNTLSIRGTDGHRTLEAAHVAAYKARHYGLETDVVISGITDIGNSVFSSWTSIKNVTLPAELRTIGDTAFLGCPSLTKINIPNGVTSLGESVFKNCTGLTSVNMPGVTSIGEGAFQECIGLTSINMPGVTSIGEYAFSKCSGLTSISLPANLKTVGSSAFSECINLTSINIPNGVTSIGYAAFEYCTKITAIVFPASVQKIEANVFLQVPNLTSVTCMGTVPPEVGTLYPGSFTPYITAFQTNRSITAVRVPNAALAAYRNSPSWQREGLPIVGF